MTDIFNGLSWIIHDGSESLKEDNWANGLFSIKSVIAHLVKACIPDYAPFPLEVIVNECLDDFQDDSGQFHSDFAKILSTKRPLPNKAHLDCDLVFELHPPICMRGKWKSQLLNIEVQNDSRRLDRCIGRGILYASSIYYMEYGRIYTYPRYEGAWPVHSIWVCPTAPWYRHGTILDFKTKMNCSPAGRCRPRQQSYDKLRLTFVNVWGDSGPGQKDIFGFIWALTTASLSVEERIRILKEDFDMQMTQPVKETIDKYDWMLDLYGRKRFTEEKKQYGEEEHEKGRQEGHEEDALNLLKLKIRPDIIQKATGISLGRLNQIALDNKLTIE